MQTERVADPIHKRGRNATDPRIDTLDPDCSNLFRLSLGVVR